MDKKKNRVGEQVGYPAQVVDETLKPEPTAAETAVADAKKPAAKPVRTDAKGRKAVAG